MKTRLVALAAALAALQGCSANDTAVEVASICSFTESCTFAATCGTTLLNKPWVDVNATDQFVVFAEVRNKAAANANPGLGRINTADAFIDRYRISISGAAVPGQVIEVGPYLVPAGGSAVLPLWLLVPGSGARAALESVATSDPGFPLVADITIEGEHQDGRSFEAEHRIAFYACSDCWDPTTCAEEDACPGIGQIGACATAPAAP